MVLPDELTCCIRIYKHSMVSNSFCSERFFVMLHEFGFGKEHKVTSESAQKRTMASVCNQITGNAGVLFFTSFVEFSCLKQIHKNMIGAIAYTNQSLINFRRYQRCKRKDFTVVQSSLQQPIELPWERREMLGIGGIDTNYASVVACAGCNVFDRVR